MTVQLVRVEIPILPATADDVKAYNPHEVELHLSDAECATVRRVLNGCRANNVKLGKGRSMTTASDVVEFLLEQIADAAG